MTKTPKLVLLAMAFLAPIALNVYAPIMPALKLSLSTSADAIQLGMTLFLIFFALGQLSCGLFVELFGQKKVLLWGVSLYILGSIIGIIVNDIYWLLIARVLQATGGGFSLLLTRSIILEQNSPNKAAAKLSYIALGIASLQAIVPTLTGYLNVYYSWHFVFYFSLVIALIAWWAIYWHLPAKSLAQPQPLEGEVTNDALLVNKVKSLTIPPSISDIVNTYVKVLIFPKFFFVTLANSLTSAGFFVFVLNVPFIVADKLAGNSQDYGKWYLIVALGFWIGSFISSQISERIGNDTMLKLGWYIAMLAALLMTISVLTAGVSYWSLFAPMALFTFGRGLLLPNAQASAVTATPYKRSTAMGVFSFCQLLIGAAFAQLSVIFVKQDTVFLPIAITLLAVLSLLSYSKSRCILAN
jgi:DHA1 family bicyclomycin/chloramphenicol resistance-like MFS transporter